MLNAKNRQYFDFVIVLPVSGSEVRKYFTWNCTTLYNFVFMFHV